MPKARAAILPILVVAIIQALTYGLLIYDARLVKARFSDLWQSAAQEHSALLAQALAPSLAVNNRGALLDILELLKNNHALSAVHYTQLAKLLNFMMFTKPVVFEKVSSIQ